MKKDIFGKWKEKAITGYADDLQHHEGRIILERMASIITSDEAKKKVRRVDANVSPEGRTGDLSIVIDEPKVKIQGATLNPETGDEHLSATNSDNSETVIPLLKANESTAPSRNDTGTNGSSDKSAFPKTESRPEDISTAPSTCIKKEGAPLILVVEDEPVTQRLLKKILEDRGYEVVIAGDGIDALMELGKRNFDLILSDLSMPNLDGFKLLDFINMKGIHTPVIFLTGSDDVEDEIKVLALGAKDYIKKPLNRDLLLLRVSKVLHQSA